ncbi:hypothetical protein CASFOL_001671 [Castilleja foliolosa]|uniref:Retrotransposon gag domain-containing protein n=1 Tax=Castilleja foliolosa TaxID=1961234 RepID=A0ABD3EC36_9LAMI
MSSDDNTKKSGELQTTEDQDLTLRIAEILRKENQGFARTTQFMQAPNIEPKLNEKNYFIWARKVKIALGGRGRWHHITGVPEPPKINEPDYYIWEQNDLQVLSWIIDSMEIDLCGQFLEYPTAHELWDGILKTYRSGEDALQIYDLNIQANRLQQGEQSIEKYYQNCQAIWREIDRRDPNDMETPIDILKFNKRMQTFRLYQFLHGADLKFDSVKRDLLKETPLSTVETAYSALRREAARAIIVNHPANEIGSGYVSQNQKSKTETKSEAVDKNKLRCDHCKKIGHLKKGCFKLIGYPDWFENNPKYQGKKKKDGGAITQTGEIDAAADELGFAAAVKTEPLETAATRHVTAPGDQRRQQLRRARRHGRAGARAATAVNSVQVLASPSTSGHLGKRSSVTRSEEELNRNGGNAAKKMTGDAKKTMTSPGSGSGLNGPNSGLDGPRSGLDELDAVNGLSPGLGHVSGPGGVIGLEKGERIKSGPIQFGSIGETGLIIKLDGPKQSDGLDQVIPMEDDDDGSFFDGLEDKEDGEPLQDPGPIEEEWDLMTRKIIGRGIERNGLYYISEIAPH